MAEPNAPEPFAAPPPDGMTDGDRAAPWERRLVVAVVVLGVGLLGGGGLWFARLARDPAWARAASDVWRVRGSVVAQPDDHNFRARYAQELLKLAVLSPQPLQTYLDWRADANCETVREATPPGTFGSCRQLHLERLLQKGDGRGLVAAAVAELEGAPPYWVGALHRYAGRGALLAEDWDLAQEHYIGAFMADGKAPDALRVGWLSLKTGQPAVALDWLDRAFAANGGYPSPQRAWIAASSIRPSERERFLEAIDAEAAFYDACRAAAFAGLDGKSADMPPLPSSIE